MRIVEARFIQGDNIEVIPLSNMTTRDYENIYQGNLYCPTQNCNARIVYSGGLRPHYRTWNHDNHTRGCIHEFERLPIRRGTYTDETLSVDIGYDRRQNALKEAVKLLNMTDEEIEHERERRAGYRNNRPRPTTAIGQSSTGANVVSTLAGGDTSETAIGIRGRNLSKRYVDGISRSDIGEVRLVMGELVGIDSINVVANLYLLRNNVQLKVVFEEAFIAEPSNARYLNNFRIIEMYLDSYMEVQFVGIGEIRLNARTGEYELVIYQGSDFKVDGDDLLSLARYLTDEN